MQSLPNPIVSKSGESTIGPLNVKPFLNIVAPRNKPDANSTMNCFKATFGKTLGRIIVVILPFCIPDNICHYAAQEVTMAYDQLSNRRPATDHLLHNSLAG